MEGAEYMTSSEIEHGTWTRRLVSHRGDMWSGMLERTNIMHPRFRRARFVLGDGLAVTISAKDLRAALRGWLVDPKGSRICPVKIDMEMRTVNGVPVEMAREG